MSETTIYLWVDYEDWKPFNLSDKKELESRGIHIGDDAQIGNDAQIGDDAHIGYDAQIGNDAKVYKTIFITGSRNTVTYWGEDKINIGCNQKTISEWLERYEEICNNHGYTVEQIAEYKQYIDFIAMLHKSTNP